MDGDDMACRSLSYIIYHNVCGAPTWISGISQAIEKNKKGTLLITSNVEVDYYLRKFSCFAPQKQAIL